MQISPHQFEDLIRKDPSLMNLDFSGFETGYLARRAKEEEEKKLAQQKTSDEKKSKPK